MGSLLVNAKVITYNDQTLIGGFSDGRGNRL